MPLFLTSTPAMMDSWWCIYYVSMVYLIQFIEIEVYLWSETLYNLQYKEAPMSIDQAKAFLKELASNQKLQQKLSDSATADERMQLAKEAGFEFTAEEFNNAHSELFVEDLDSVSGGGWACGTTCGTECGKLSQTVCG